MLQKDFGEIHGGYGDNQGGSHRRYCKTGLVPVDRSRVVLAFFDLIDKAPFDATGFANKS